MPAVIGTDGDASTILLGLRSALGKNYMSGWRKENSNYIAEVNFARPSTGEAYDATGTVTVEFYKDGGASPAQSSTMTKKGSKTGYYTAPAWALTTANGLNGDITVRVTATVDGVAVAGIIDRFDVVPLSVETATGYVTLASDGLDQVLSDCPTSKSTTLIGKLNSFLAMMLNVVTRNRETGDVTIYKNDGSTPGLVFTTPPDRTVATVDTKGAAD